LNDGHQQTICVILAVQANPALQQKGRIGSLVRLQVTESRSGHPVAQTDEASLNGRSTLQAADGQPIVNQAPLMQFEAGSRGGEGGHLQIGGVATRQGGEPKFHARTQLSTQRGTEAP